MGMSVTLGTTTDDPRKITKNVTWDNAAIPCNPTDPCDVLNPTIILAYNSSAGIFTKNYAKIPDWGNRMYFIKDIQVLTGGKILLSLGIDVLGTYDTQIRDCDCTITRAQWTGRTMIPDDQYPINTSKRELKVATLHSLPFSPQDATVIVQVISGTKDT